MNLQKNIDLEKLLCLNDPIRLSMIGYIFDRKFMETNIGFFPNLGFDAYDRINKLTAPEVKKIIKSYNPLFDADHSGVRLMLEKLVSAGFLERETRNELNKKGKPSKRNVVCYFPSVSEDIQAIARYIMNSVVSLELDYEKTITDKTSIGKGTVVNSRRWDFVRSLYPNPKSIKEIVESTNITYDTFYNSARPLAEAEIITAPYLGRSSRVRTYLKTNSFNDRSKRTKLHEVHEEKLHMIDENILIGQYFSDKDLQSLFPDNCRSSIIRFRQQLQSLGMIKISKTPSCDKFGLSFKGYRLHNLIIKYVDKFLNTGELPDNITYDKVHLRKALSYHYKS